VLFNNGGIMVPPLDLKTSAGYDIQFGTNVLGHYLLTTLLLPALIRAAQTGEHAASLPSYRVLISMAIRSERPCPCRKYLQRYALDGPQRWGRLHFTRAERPSSRQKEEKTGDRAFVFAE
jgi:NAD(P)-dependent dehydrogenase (short-subunit alcohol dehydrogenase family)